MTAVLHGIGAGPGDPELITLKGLRLLQEAQCVFLPATRAGQSYAGGIVGGHLNPARQRVIELLCPAYRVRAMIEQRWVELSDTVAVELSQGGPGAFISEGDPSLYSTFQYLAAALRERHPEVRVVAVPGVTSISAAAALAGRPLASWDERLTILPATHSAGSLDAVLRDSESVALLKLSGALGTVLDQVDALGPGVDVALVRRAGRPEEMVLTDTAAMRALEPDYFTTLLLRKIKLREIKGKAKP